MRFSLRGAPHAGLACDRYVQVTAPLRRFLDWVMQRQIVSHLGGGGPAFRDAAQLQRWAEEAQRRLAILREVERKIEDDWKRRYLAQNIGLELWGHVRGKTAAVWLEEIMLPAEAELPAKVGRGMRGRFRVAAVDLDRHQVWVEVVQ